MLVMAGIMARIQSGRRNWFTASLGAAAILSIAYRISLSSMLHGAALAAAVALIVTLIFALRVRRSRTLMPGGMIATVSAIVVGMLAWGIAAAP